MIGKRFRSAVLSLALAAGFGAAPALADDLKELNFGIISTESSQNLKPVWDPFLADMTRKLGIKVNAFFAPDYAGVIEGMRFGKVDVAWYGNKAAMEAVDRANGEIFVQTVAADGSPGYWSLLLAHKDNAKLNSVDDVIKLGKELTFSNGDPNSTSGFLVPGYYVFGLNKIDPKSYFKHTVSGNHESNALAVANKQVDFATGNTENMAKLEKNFPEKFQQIKIIWKSPLIPSDPIVWRKDLTDGDKAKIKDFFMTYGVKGTDAAKEKEILAGLQWAPFKESNDDQLVPIRILSLFKTRMGVEADTTLAEADKQQKLAEIDAKLDELKKKQPVTN
ncbi:phosphonate ABC transporter substrate-binding protein [Dongia sedimenti]|uniref:Phosphonate ABC transporter substrate-binding protein n=1 Tax=Dongia sedimenti TaxID=3064282 RepID=A0ABU0YVE4_9PROT|nr:phosphonate ABC transporter substrate-binding protein [Rhodospirillaceae bacterium R-7]